MSVDQPKPAGAQLREHVGMPHISRIGDISLLWGESLRWDDRRRRLYFVDCGTQMLHWLDRAEPPLRSLQMPSLPTGLALAEDGRVVAALNDGLYIVDPDAGHSQLLSAYPAGLGGRANDAAADLDGNLVTGTLNFQQAPGSYWWYSVAGGWRQLDDGISNANGPVVVDIDGVRTLVFADTVGSVLYAYDYDGATGTATHRRVLVDTAELGGAPDGACADADGGVWSCMLGAGTIVRWGGHGISDIIDSGVELPSDVTFGGDELDRMFFVSIAVGIAGIAVTSPNAGAVMAVDGLGHRGRPEPRIRL
jgi:sugar lactone lactonase YvrE